MKKVLVLLLIIQYSLFACQKFIIEIDIENKQNYSTMTYKLKKLYNLIDNNKGKSSIGNQIRTNSSKEKFYIPFENIYYIDNANCRIYGIRGVEKPIINKQKIFFDVIKNRKKGFIILECLYIN